MARKTLFICDRCNANVPENELIFCRVLTLGRNYELEFELCKVCHGTLIAWLKLDKLENETDEERGKRFEARDLEHLRGVHGASTSPADKLRR